MNDELVNTPVAKTDSKPARLTLTSPTTNAISRAILSFDFRDLSFIEH
jgi:hypothetical protein